jgi:prephenate dehydrogenase
MSDINVLVVGTGLIGTSIGLALSGCGLDVRLHDRHAARLATAVRRGAGRPWRLGAAPDDVGAEHRDRTEFDWVDHVVLATPPSEVGAALRAWQRLLPRATFSDTASVKVAPLEDGERAGADMSAVCGAHPVAGRECSGPEWASADLFAGRSWVLTPSAVTSSAALANARAVALACGARVTEMPARAHDLALGLLSHVPHLVASAMAARLVAVSDDVVSLAGPGLWDFTRIAGANAELWSDIVAANASPIAALLADVVADLDRVRGALDAAGSDPAPVLPEVDQLFRLGNAGRFRLEAVRSRQADVGRLVPLQDDPRLATVAPDGSGADPRRDHESRLEREARELESRREPLPAVPLPAARQAGLP